MKTTPWSALTLHKPLREVFWFYGVIPSHILWGMTLLAYFNGATLGTNLLMFAVVLVYTAWIIAQIWVSSSMQKATIYSDALPLNLKMMRIGMPTKIMIFFKDCDLMLCR